MLIPKLVFENPDFNEDAVQKFLQEKKEENNALQAIKQEKGVDVDHERQSTHEDGDSSGHPIIIAESPLENAIRDLVSSNEKDMGPKRKWSCNEPGCPKSAHGKTSKCVAHGGGRRCDEPSCQKLAKQSGDCIAHYKLTK